MNAGDMLSYLNTDKPNRMEINDTEIIAAIKKGGNAREKTIKELYYDQKCRIAVSKYIHSTGGNNFDVEDIFQEAIITMDRKIRSGEFLGYSKVTTFLVGIAKFTWLNQVRKDRKTNLTNDPDIFDEINCENPEQIHITAERNSTLQNIINKLGEGCRQILRLWKLSYSMDEIAQKLELSSAKYARKKKYRCMKKLMTYIESHGALDDLYY